MTNEIKPSSWIAGFGSSPQTGFDEVRRLGASFQILCSSSEANEQHVLLIGLVYSIFHRACYANLTLLRPETQSKAGGSV